MEVHTPSWWRDSLRLFVQYLGVAYSALPAGIVYLALLNLGANQRLALIASLSLGLVSAHLTWRYIGRRLLSPAPRRKEVVAGNTDATADVNVQVSRLRLAGGMPAVFIVVFAASTHYPTVKISQTEVENDGGTAPAYEIVLSEV
ncbi:MAG TPA: hypothetical protein VGP08_15150 [Pyrinomonadaceae bacterium]|jgi:hypothetical protein|nr:hypothetical protein [Pyrinomonadaceae bacterium]